MQLPDTPRPIAAKLLAFGQSDTAAKASYLLVAVAAARTMDATAIGFAVAAIAASDILKSFVSAGIGQRILDAPQDRLDSECVTARRLLWLICGVLACLQIALAAVVGLMTGHITLFALIAILAGEYLFLPVGLVLRARAMRAGMVQETAALEGARIIGGNLLAVILAAGLAGPIALVLPRLLAAPVWAMALHRRLPWSPAPNTRPAPFQPILRHAWDGVGTALPHALRRHSDKVMIGALMGPEMLGIYFVAFNAGLGLATIVTRVLSKLCVAHLCTATERDAVLREHTLMTVSLLLPAVILLAAAAPLYVPLIFGAQWTGIETIVSLLSLMSIPAILWWAASTWMRAGGRPDLEAVINGVHIGALIFNIVMMAPFGLTAIAMGALAMSMVIQIGGAVPALFAVFRPIFEKAI